MALRTLLRVGLLAVASGSASCAPKPVPPVYPDAILLDQGSNWTTATRSLFYSQSQGSDVIPLRWIKALKQPNGDPFLAASLARYGYLPNKTTELPVGFTVSGPTAQEVLGMTCAACHTRQITVGNVPYRVDGGPAMVDFQSFLSDLDAAMGTVVADNGNNPAFAAFAQAVLGHVPTPAEAAHLDSQLQTWFGPYHTLMAKALPLDPWGPGRLDAVGMIFNRLTGLDIGATPDRVIAENIRLADAPVRYPFLWNSPVQDKTQWPGFADNGNDLLALTRNVGEVYGVFATFHPKKDPTFLLGYDYLHDNSTNFAGLQRLEDVVKQLGPPKWPFRIDPVLAARGAQIYGRTPREGMCAQCHGIQRGAVRSLSASWLTPVVDVGTDTREYDLLSWTASTGVLRGATIIPGVLGPLGSKSESLSILAVSVAGSILENATSFSTAQAEHLSARAALSSAPETAELRHAYNRPPTPHAYESRVLQGIWAAAPYLHNGSVPTLADLLTPASQRPASFAVGPAYDVDHVGLAREQTRFNYTLKTTDCSDVHSGNSRCGHEYGTNLPPDDRRALLEYLKTL